MVLPSSGVYQAGAMIRGQLIAKQTQVFDKKADQMIAASADSRPVQITEPRPVWCLAPHAERYADKAATSRRANQSPVSPTAAFL
jgi:hypothetical protein